MKDEIKEILDDLKNDFYVYGETYIEEKCKIVTKKKIQQLLDYITNLQEEKENQTHTIKILLEENERLKKIARKMHLWIFLHSSNEQEVYDELGLTDEENAMLGYSGQFRLKGENNNE